MFRLAIGVAALILLAAIAIQIVLWTSFPRSMVVSQIEKGMGLRIAVKSLSTNWLGHTTLRDVELSLPLSSQSFLNAPELKVRHTNLLGILLGWPVTLKSIELHKPVLYVRQNTVGKWNLQEVAVLISRAGGKKTGEQTAQTSSTPALPWVKISELTIVVQDNRRHQALIAPINVDGQPETPVSWKYDVNIPSHLSLVGRVAPGGIWAHEVRIAVHDVSPWVRPWKPTFSQPTDLAAHWSGELSSTGVHGFLQELSAVYGQFQVDGALAAAADDGIYTINPDNLHLRTPYRALAELGLSAGSISYDGKEFRGTRLQLVMFGGPATIDGSYQPQVRQGALQARWENFATGKISRHSGTLQAKYAAPLAAPLDISGRLDTRGVAPGGPFEVVADFGATGPSFKDLAWDVTAPGLAWYRGQPVILNGLHATGALQDTRLQLTTVALPAGDRLAGAGFYDLSGGQWQLHLEGQDWPVHLIEGTRLAFALDGNGKSVPSRTSGKKLVPFVTLDQFFLRSGDAELRLKGVYDGREPKPVAATVDFANQPSGADQVGRPALVHGQITGQATLAGQLDPKTNIAVSGWLSTRDATILGHPVGDMRTVVLGGIDEDKTWLAANGIPFLDGIWGLGATYLTKEPGTGKDVYATTVTMSVQHLPLQKLTQFFNAQQALGGLSGSWNISFPGLAPRREQIAVTGGGEIQKLSASYLLADQVTFKTKLQDGVFSVDPVQLRRGNYGRIDAHADLRLSQWRQVHAGVNFTAWPIELSGAQLTLQLWRGADAINIFLPEPSAKDPAARKLRADTSLNLRTAVSFRDQPEGEVTVQADMKGRVVDLRDASGVLFGGSVHADGVTDLDQVTRSRANLAWSNIQSERFVRLFPQLKGLAGTFSATARLQPATSPRPLEPLMLDVYLRSIQAHWRTVRIGDGEVHAYLSASRLIADDIRRSSIQLANGLLYFWFSSRSHLDTAPVPGGGSRPTGVTISNHVNLDLEEISIDQFVKAFDPKHPPGFGRLSGNVFLLSAPKTQALAAIAQEAAALPDTPGPVASAATSQAIAHQQDMLQRILSTTTLDGSLKLRDSNLANFGPIAFLYNAMRLGQDVRTPTGYGSVALHMEQGKLHVSNLYFFNRGIEVRGVATADKMWNLPDNPIHGSAIGTARPLKNIHLPLFAEADAILSALQGELTSVEFKGTVKNPVKDYIRLLRITQLGDEIRGLLLGDVGANRGG